MHLAEAKAAEQVTDEDVRLAEAEAVEVAELAAQLELRAIEDPKPPKPGDVVEQRALAGFARSRAERTRNLADKAKAANRLLALDQVGQDIASLAADAAKPDAGIAKALADLQAAAATLTDICRQYDDKVRALVARAKALDVEDAAPSGPRATSAHVALISRRVAAGLHSAGGGGIQAGSIVVGIIGDRAAAAIQLAISGDAAGAATRLGAIREQPPLKRADRYYRAAGGGIIPQSGPETNAFAQQVSKGLIQRLTDAEVDAYLDGRLDHG